MENNSKKQISITITDIEDTQKVLEALDILFHTILISYIDKGDFYSFNTFVLMVSIYFGKLLKLLGYTEGDFGNEGNFK